MLSRAVGRDRRPPRADVGTDRRAVDRAEMVDPLSERNREWIAAQLGAVLAVLHRHRRERHLAALHRCGGLGAKEGLVHELAHRASVGAIRRGEAPPALTAEPRELRGSGRGRAKARDRGGIPRSADESGGVRSPYGESYCLTLLS